MADMPAGFILSDVQIVGSFQLDDISNLFINGEIPNPFAHDKMEQINQDIIEKEMMTDEDPWKIFTKRVKRNLYIILVFSPYGSCFRDSMLACPTESSASFRKQTPTISS